MNVMMFLESVVGVYTSRLMIQISASTLISKIKNNSSLWSSHRNNEINRCSYSLIIAVQLQLLIEKINVRVFYTYTVGKNKTQSTSLRISVMR